MKKIYLIACMASALISQQVTAQQEFNFGDFPKPVPSVSSLPTYTDSPVSIATGVPDIKLPLLELPTNDKNFSMSLVLQYHSRNVNEQEPASDVGIGWSLFAGGVISREIISGLDEKFDNASASNYIKNKFDDIYYYNIPGAAGKFKIERNTTDNTFRVINLTPNNIKIEYVKAYNNATLIIDSFTITDDNGYKYIFNEYSQNRSNEGILYRSAFYLTQITNPHNIEFANFSYQKDNKYKPNSSVLLYQFCKLKTITSPDMGSLAIDYTYETSLENTMNDPYSISRVSLKNKAGNIISQYGLEYSLFSYPMQGINQYESKRILTKINKINIANPTGVPLEKTTLKYNMSGSDNNYSPNMLPTFGEYICPSSQMPNPNQYSIGLLEKIIMPSGGVIQYNFEANQLYVNKNIQGYISTEFFSDPEIQYIDFLTDIPFNTNTATLYQFQVTGTPNTLKKVYIEFNGVKHLPPVFWDPQSPTYVDYSVDNNSPVLCSSYNNPETQGSIGSIGTIALYPGNHTIKIFGSGGEGTFSISQLANVPPPFKNVISTDKSLGVRIKNIQYYNAEQDNQPKKTASYDYNVFNDPNSVSGYQFYPESDAQSSAEYYPGVIYKNVKVINEADNGYTKYYFKTPGDYPLTPYTVNGNSTNFWPYYNITKTGIIEKKEVFNFQDHLVSSTLYDFTFETLNLPDVGVSGIYTKPAFIKKTIVTTKDEASTNQLIESKVETDFNSSNFKIASMKETSSDGNITEKLLTYPIGLSDYQNLQNANMTGVPVKTEIKNNGKLVSKTEVKYNDPYSATYLFPSSVVSVNPNDNSTKTMIKYDQYDQRGHLRQFTSNYDPATGQGIPTTIVWGYHNTLPIAKIEGGTINDPIFLDIVEKSNDDNLPPQGMTAEQAEKNLLLALDAVRNNPALKNFLITTYTYDPLIGVTTVTPPNGMREMYRYDQNNRLKAVVDVNGNIIKDYKYNTKPQP